MDDESGAKAVKLALRFVAFCALALSSTALADEANEHFERGVKLAEAGSIPEAEEELEKAWALRKAWDIAGNLGLTEAAQGKWEEAADHMHYALRFIGSLATDEQRKGLEERYANVRARLSLVNVKGNAPFTIKLGERTQASDAPVFLGEGKHKLECVADGYESVTLEVTAVKGETQNLTVTLKKLTPTVIGPTKPLEEAAMWPAVLLGTTGGTLFAAGLGSLIGGLVVKADVDEGTASGRCNTDPSCTDLQSSLDDAKLLGTLGVVGLAVGATALAGMGLYIALVPDTEPTAAKLGLQLSPDGIAIQGSF